jgi:membrane protein insertase Oxa1/YidC/SpoIIIJ
MFLTTLELGLEGQTTTMPILKIIMRVFAVLMIPFTWSFPQILHLYWVSTTGFTFLQFFILRIKPLAKRLGADPGAIPPWPSMPKFFTKQDSKQTAEVVLFDSKPKKPPTPKQ